VPVKYAILGQGHDLTGDPISEDESAGY
jgi:hypothetical protein